MEREKISDFYEDFEPEMRIWPYWVLGLLIPLVPFCLSLTISLALPWQSIMKYFVSVLPLFFTAFVMKDGEKAWLLIFSGGVYASSTLLMWVNAALEGAISYPLGIPLAFAVSPSILSLIAFAFFQKRKRGSWVFATILSVLLSIALTALSLLSERGELILSRGIYPLLLVVLSLSMCFVTRRSDSTPWFVFLILILLLISSSLFHSGIMSLLEGVEVEGATIVSSVLGIFVHDNEFWYTLTFLFVFSGLAGKSSYRKIVEEVEEEKTTEKVGNEDISEDKRYSFPPSSSRFAPSIEKPKEEKREERREEYTEPKRPEYREEERPDDKWYEFISGGVKEERRDPWRDERRYERDYRNERRRDDYPPPRRDPYYRDDERGDRRDYHRSYYTDVMDDDRRYRDDRDYRDDRYYREDRDKRPYPRRERRDYGREDDEYMDRRNYDDWDR